MSAGDLLLMITFAVLAYIALSIAEGPKHRALCDYIAKVAMAQWKEWLEEWERTGRWNH